MNGLYQVSNLGRVKSLSRKRIDRNQILPERILKPIFNRKRGYYQIYLRKNNISYTFKPHRLVAEAFIPNPENKPYVDHIDTDKSNNKVDNLRWVTPSENSNNPLSVSHMLESWDNSDRRKHQREINLGELHPRAKSVCQLDEEGNVINTFFTSVEAANYLGCKRANITKCCLGERKHAGGYRWKYA